MPEFKTRMREFRKEMNLQQAELAELVGVRRETIGKLENGKYNPSLKLAIDISRVFGRPVEEVFIFEEDTGEEECMAVRKDNKAKRPAKNYNKNT